MKKTAEQKLNEAILQKKSKAVIGGKEFEIAPPCIATLYEVSALISNLPALDINTEDPIGETLRIAKDCKVEADIIAMLILGARENGYLEEIKESKTIVEDVIETKLFGLIRQNKQVEKAVETTRTVDRFVELKNFILYNAKPSELQSVLVDILVNRMEIGFFLQITTSLSAVNMTKPTKTTAPTP